MKKQEIAVRSLIALLSGIAVLALFLFREVLGAFSGIIQILLIVVLGFSAAPLLAEQAAKPAGSIYAGNNRRERTPRLSAAESAAKRQEYTLAAKLYREAQEQFPAYLPLYPALFDILIHRLHDLESARTVYRIGWNAVSGEERKKLEHLFQEFTRSSSGTKPE